MFLKPDLIGNNLYSFHKKDLIGFIKKNCEDTYFLFSTFKDSSFSLSNLFWESKKQNLKSKRKNWKYWYAIFTEFLTKNKKNLNDKEDQERGERGGGRGKEQFLENIE